MYENLQNYLDGEIHEFKVATFFMKEWSTLEGYQRYRDYTLQRIMGATFFAEHLGLDFEIIDRMYGKAKAEIMATYEKGKGEFA